MSDLNRRVAKIENPIRNHRAGDDVSIRFDQLRIPYETDDERELAQSQIATKGREAFFGGHLSKDAGWQQISVEDSCDMQSHVIRAAAISLETGLMSKILDDDEALYILRVTHRPK
ncbi:hypothetical protein [Rhodopirellula halodulae]|uniref:hypothetical protein n=1 Tax=Rhodopirellula halodulae TaxID=2894198 RepID=UPI001E44A168|nr:hypothetical protein [Rhodopirellula sp. JC737]